MDNPGRPVLSLRDVYIRRNNNFALNLARLDVAEGEVVALLGPNGSGKSTILQIAALLLKPDLGIVELGGERATRKNASELRRKTSTVFQAPLLFHRTVRENVESGLRFRGVDASTCRREASEWLNRFGVEALAERNARSISGGEAQRVNLARAMIVQPQLLLLDEPFGSLDAATRTAILAELAVQLHEMHGAVLLVTHDRSEVDALATRVVTIENGEIVADEPYSTPQEVAGK